MYKSLHESVCHQFISLSHFQTIIASVILEFVSPFGLFFISLRKTLQPLSCDLQRLQYFCLSSQLRLERPSNLVTRAKSCQNKQKVDNPLIRKILNPLNQIHIQTNQVHLHLNRALSIVSFTKPHSESCANPLVNVQCNA